jgi:hypothetical protein
MFDLNHQQVQFCLKRINDFLSSRSPEWATNGESRRYGGLFPRKVVPVLLEILKYYFDAGSINGCSDNFSDYPGLDQLLPKLAILLSEVSETDANVLYAKQFLNGTIVTGSAAEMLKDLFNGKLSRTQMLSFASMLAMEDASFIVRDCKPLESIYLPQSNRHVGLGLHFNLKTFKHLCLPELFKGASARVQSTLSIIDQLSTDRQDFTDEIINQIKECFKLRWAEIRNTSLQYTRVQETKQNSPWILVAQLLNGARLTPYYGLLMPTLSSSTKTEPLTNIVSGSPVETEPLTHYILSRDGKTLIHLPTSVNYYKEGCLLMNRSVYPATYLTSCEVAQILYARKQFLPYYKACIKKNIHRPAKSVELPIKRSTVYWVYDLLQKTLKKQITDTEIQAEYTQFCVKLNSLVCLVQVIEDDPDAETIQRVLELRRIIFVRKAQVFEIGYRNVHGKYVQKPITNAEFLQHYQNKELVTPPDCCALLMTCKPKPSEKSQLLGIYSAAYIRVVDKKCELNELWYVANRSNEMIRISNDLTQLEMYDRCIFSTPVPQAVNEDSVLSCLGVSNESLVARCSIQMTHKPISNQISRLLGGFKQGFIRVFNSNPEKDGLYLADVVENQLTKLNLTPVRLLDYDLKVGSTPLPKMLIEADLDNIYKISGHVADHRHLVEQQLLLLEDSALKKLDEERQRLNRQTIEWGDTTMTFEEIMAKIAKGDEIEGCITVWGKYLVKFVVDHFPEITFNKGIENSVGYDNLLRMREHSEHIPCSDDPNLSKDEVIRRNGLLLISLFTTHASEISEGSTCQLAFGDCKNQFSQVKFIASVFKQLLANLAHTDKIKDVYTFLMSNFIYPLEQKKELCTLPKDVQKWITTVRNPTFFSAQSPYYDPGTLFVALSLIYPTNLSSITTLTDDILRIIMQKGVSPELIKVGVNIKLAQFFQKCTWAEGAENIRKGIDGLILQKREEIYRACYAYLMRRAKTYDKSSRAASKQISSQHSHNDAFHWNKIPGFPELTSVVEQDYKTVCAHKGIEPEGLSYLSSIRENIGLDQLIAEFNTDTTISNSL